jgi:hypothetical protein
MLRFVGWVRTGVKQGDPMATILFLQPSSTTDRDVRNTHPDVVTPCFFVGAGEIKPYFFVRNVRPWQVTEE